MKKALYISILSVIIMIIVTAGLVSQTITRQTLNSGGMRATNSDFILNGSIGIEAVGISSGGGNRLYHGFWYGNEYPILEIIIPVDDDGDGASTAEEASAPNSGDGNGDGVADANQTNVASLVSVTNSYITVEVSGCDSILSVTNYEADTDGSIVFPFGLIDFSLPCGEATIKVYYHNAPTLEGYTYRKLTAANSVVELNAAVLGAELIDGVSVPFAEFTLVDGSIFDFDGKQDGRIRDPGGPSFVLVNIIPVWDWWWVLLLVGGGWVVWRRRVLKS